MTAFHGWENFYVIVGSAAGALIGLQFVVLTLIADKLALRPTAGGAAFSTPTIIHFSVVFLLAAIFSAPWFEIITVAAVWGVIGVCGIIYIFSVARSMKKQTVYKPVFEDWLFHALLPLVAHIALVTSAFMVHSYERLALFIVGAASLLLLVIGIHNAWDTVTYHVFVSKDKKQSDSKK